MSDTLREALRRQRAAARHGFDWPRTPRWERELWAKLQEEIVELRAVRRQPRAAREELGDLLFMVVNVARYLGVDPRAALAGANAKFQRRFDHILRHAGRLPPRGHPRRLAAMERLWNEAKSLEAQRAGSSTRRRPGNRRPRRGSPPG